MLTIMKKLFYLLFALPLLLISCDDDNKLPDILRREHTNTWVILLYFFNSLV